MLNRRQTKFWCEHACWSIAGRLTGVFAVPRKRHETTHNQSIEYIAIINRRRRGAGATGHSHSFPALSHRFSAPGITAGITAQKRTHCRSVGLTTRYVNRARKIKRLPYKSLRLPRGRTPFRVNRGASRRVVSALPRAGESAVTLPRGRPSTDRSFAARPLRPSPVENEPICRKYFTSRPYGITPKRISPVRYAAAGLADPRRR